MWALTVYLFRGALKKMRGPQSRTPTILFILRFFAVFGGFLLVGNRIYDGCEGFSTSVCLGRGFQNESREILRGGGETSPGSANMIC